MQSEDGHFDSSSAVLTREVRWFYTGALPEGVRTWFTLSNVSTDEYRLDIYDLASARNGVGRKHRGRSTLDTKFRIDAFTDIELASGVTGQVEDWMKISEPLEGLPTQQLADPIRVEKRIHTRRFSLSDSTDSGCEAELADIEAGGKQSWSLCLETFGAPEARVRALQYAARNFFSSSSLPVEIQLDMSSSVSYPDWISRLAFQNV